MDSPCTAVEWILVRHTAVDVPPGTCYGQMDIPLAGSFPHDAEAVRMELSRIFQDTAPDLVFSSPSSRCTALATACGWPDCVTDARLMERSFGSWEGLRYDDIADSRLKDYYEDWLHTAPTGGESFTDQLARVRRFLECAKNILLSDESRKTRPKVLIFTHGGVISAACVLTGACAAEDAWSHCPPYGGIISLRY